MVKILIFQFYFLALHFLSVFSSKIPDRTDGLRSGEFRQVSLRSLKIRHKYWIANKWVGSQSFRSKCVFWNIFSLLRNISSLLTNFSILLWIFLECRESFPVFSWKFSSFWYFVQKSFLENATSCEMKGRHIIWCIWVACKIIWIQDNFDTFWFKVFKRAITYNWPFMQDYFYCDD